MGMRVTTMIIQYALNVERNTWECVDWGQTPATFVARKVIMRETAPLTARTRTLNTRIEMQIDSCVRCKQRLKALRLHKED
ncbi:hypothetical protein TIFTF001_028401 [Ficus carica]|uniref:Uncharacterized protein n=1 Tax=Ficus carica TaxID=3494 RepID=A0AA88DPZ2_FICCA|nr:hypothetical protein TIFTF001_028401 [Ficus carica]